MSTIKLIGLLVWLLVVMLVVFECLFILVGALIVTESNFFALIFTTTLPYLIWFTIKGRK